MTAEELNDLTKLHKAERRCAEADGLLRDALESHGRQLLIHPPIDKWEHHKLSERIAAFLAARG